MLSTYCALDTQRLVWLHGCSPQGQLTTPRKWERSRSYWTEKETEAKRAGASPMATAPQQQVCVVTRVCQGTGTYRDLSGNGTLTSPTSLLPPRKVTSGLGH